MDGQRFDDLTKALAGGATRRRALRLAGGGLAGALLAVVRPSGAGESTLVKSVLQKPAGWR